jgi:hypothetical protein
MTSWISFLLRQGVNDGKALISPASLAAMWTSQISIGDSNGYGMGWFVRSWQGQRLIEHGGAIPGFRAEVGLLPDSNLGFVVLTAAVRADEDKPQSPAGQFAAAKADWDKLKGTLVAARSPVSRRYFTLERNGRRRARFRSWNVIPSAHRRPLGPGRD